MRDITKMPIIGTVTTKEIKYKVTDDKGNSQGEYLLPKETYSVVEIEEKDDKKFYITNIWHKEYKKVPLVIASEIVEKYEPVAKNGIYLAPNGKPSNLTPEQYKSVRTPEFKAWFGDWENDPKNSSKVLDENGEPKVLFHGTKSEFSIFRQNRFIYTSDSIDYQKKLFTSKSERIFELFGNANKVLDLTQFGEFEKDLNKINKFFKEKSINFTATKFRQLYGYFTFGEITIEKLKEAGYNAVRLVFESEYKGLIGESEKIDYSGYIFIEPNQVKLADGTNTTFDSKNPNIRFNNGGDLKNKVFVHETNAEPFDDFDLNKVGSGQGDQWLGRGIYLQEKGSFKIEKYGKNKVETILKPNANIFKVEDTPDGKYRDNFVEWAVENTEVGKRKAQERIDNGLSLNNLLPRDILKSSLVVEKLKEQGYDGLYQDGELVIYNPDVLQIKKFTKYANGGLIAPNGKPSNLTPEQYRLVRTKEFKNWFGDWEKAHETGNYDNVSKVIDEVTKEPLVVYHGSRVEFNIFNGRASWKANYKEEIGTSYFTSDKDMASGYGGDSYIYALFLNFKNPLIYDAEGISYIGANYNALSKARNDNKDSTIIRNVDDTSAGREDRLIDTYISFNPTQIKLADGSNTTFDGSNPDIRYADGNEIGKITCHNCSWSWEYTDGGDDKFICHKCGADNSKYYKNGGPTFNDKELLAKWKRGQSIGFTATAHLKAKGLIPRADGTKRKSEFGDVIGGNVIDNVPEVFTDIDNLNSLLKKLKIGISLVEDVGSGMFGYAYLTDKNTILKVTTSDNDAFRNYKIYKLQNKLKSQAKVLNILRITNKEKNVYLIEKEKTMPIRDIIENKEDEIFWGTFWKWIESSVQDNGQGLGNYINDKTAENLFDLFYKYILEVVFLNNYKEFEKSEIKKEADINKKQAIKILDDFVLFHNRIIKDEKLLDLEYDDIHSGNYGYEKGKFLCFDCIVEFVKVKKEEINKINEIETKKVTKFADGGLIAPNGKPSNLTPEQYRLVRTPNFKKWFGDWENSPETSSKVVDENGEPLMVYHGSRSEVKFAFSEFNVPEEGVYFSSDYITATWFSGGSDDKLQFQEIELPSNINENSTLKDLENYYKDNIDTTAYVSLYNFDDGSGSVMYRLEAYNETSSTPLGKNLKDAQKRLYKEINYRINDINYDTKRPFYKVFLNIRNPYKIDAKGKSFYETPFENGNYAAVSVTSTIKARGKNDGVIIKNTIETTELNRKSNSYIVFYPNQIKLADGTNKTFDSKNDDIRFMSGGNIRKKISSGGGDCYYVAGQFAMGVLSPEKIDYKGTPYIVHAEVQGQGHISHIRYGHAWVEDDENVYDFSNNRKIIFPKQLYYSIGDVKTDNPQKYRKYTFQEARRKMVETKHYGCWDLDVEYRDGGNVLLAPNGKPSNLNPEQYRLVRTTAFKKWFGDWENSPETASKILDDNGEPLICYHGSKKEFSVFFNFNKEEKYKPIFFFAKNIINSKFYGKNIYTTFLNIRNPKIYIESFDPEIYIDEKFDGVIIKRNKNYDNWYVATESYQIKLADGTNTTFDSNNPDIRYEIGGGVERLIYTPNFKKWFGNWQDAREEAIKNIVNNDYSIVLPYTSKGINKKFFSGVSKVMDKEPKIVWHGSNNDFNIFDNKSGLPYFYFSDKKNVAKLYGNIVKPYYLNIKNPILFYADCSTFNELGNTQSVVHKLMYALVDAKKYNTNQYVYYYETEYVVEPNNDGIIIKDIVDAEIEEELEKLGDEIEKIDKLKKDYCSDVFIVINANQIKLADGTNTTFDSNNPDIRFNDGGNIEIKYYIVHKDKKPLFRTKFGEYNKETERDMIDKLDALADLSYELKPVSFEEYRNFDYSKINMADLKEFMQKMNYYEEGGYLHGSKYDFCNTGFKLNKAKGQGESLWGKGLYFTKDRTLANYYAKFIQSPNVREMLEQKVADKLGFKTYDEIPYEYENKRFRTKYGQYLKFDLYNQYLKQYVDKSKEKGYVYEVTLFPDKKDYRIIDFSGTDHNLEQNLKRDKEDFSILIDTLTKNKRKYVNQIKKYFDDRGWSFDKERYVSDYNYVLKQLKNYYTNFEKYSVSTPLLYNVAYDLKSLFRPDYYKFSLKTDVRAFSNTYNALSIEEKTKIIEEERDEHGKNLTEFFKDAGYSGLIYHFSPNLIPYVQHDEYDSDAIVVFDEKDVEIDNCETFKKGGPVRLSKTPAPKSERIYGSAKNKPGTSASSKKASSIVLSDKVTESIRKIISESSKKIPLATAKAVVRRGMGAYSSTHRPTISGGKPNSRVAWGLARLKAFVYKIKHGQSKSGKYKQDDDLIKELGYRVKNYAGGGEVLLAPNGKPSNLTPEQYRLVRTPAFKKWFGDWENSPETASKVVDENGEPLVVYHGSENNFYQFDENKIGSNSPLKDKKGFFFTSNKEEAKEYGNIINVFLSIKNPLIDNTQDKYWTSGIYYWDMRKNQYINDSKNKEGVIVLSSASNVYVAFNPNQIKLADGTNTTFDSNNPDMRYELGGLFHGSPNDFCDIGFDSKKVGNSFKKGAMGWGIYFSNKKDIAKRYSVIPGENQIISYEKAKELLRNEQKVIGIKRIETNGHIELMVNIPKKEEDLDKDFRWHKEVDLPFIYRVTLHKGKLPNQYDYAEPILTETQILKLKKQALAENIILPDLKYIGKVSNLSVAYNYLSDKLNGDKEASLFFLRAGIDGIKYPCRFTDYDAAETLEDCYNYVVFDSSNVSIEECDIVKIELLKHSVINDFQSGSSLDFYNDLIFIVGDDAKDIVILDKDFTEVNRVNVFQSETRRIPKEIKYDLETSTIIDINGVPNLLILGSGAKQEFRSVGYLIPLNTKTVINEPFRYNNFVRRLKENDGIKEINIEGCTSLPNKFLLANRGNKTNPDNLLIVTENLFWENQENVPISICRMLIPDKDAAVSEIYYEKETDTLFFTASIEHTTNAIDDGNIGDSFLGYIKNVSSKLDKNTIEVDYFKNLVEVSGVFVKQKIEGICIEESTKDYFIINLVSDNDNEESTIFKLKLKKWQ